MTQIVLDDKSTCTCPEGFDEYWQYAGDDPSEVSCPVCRHILMRDWDDILLHRDLVIIENRRAEKERIAIQAKIDSGEYALMPDDYTNNPPVVDYDEVLKVFKGIDDANSNG